MAEGRLDDFRLSGLSKAQISRIEFLDPKWLYPPKTVWLLLSFSDCPLKIFGPRKKIFLTSSLANFAQKIEFKGSKNFKMTVKIPETFIKCWTGSWDYIKTIRLYSNRYTRILQRMPSNIVLKIFPNIYHTFGHTRATFIPFTEKRRPPGQPQGNFKQT